MAIFRRVRCESGPICPYIWHDWGETTWTFQWSNIPRDLLTSVQCLSSSLTSSLKRTYVLHNTSTIPSPSQGKAHVLSLSWTLFSSQHRLFLLIVRLSDKSISWLRKISHIELFLSTMSHLVPDEPGCHQMGQIKVLLNQVTNIDLENSQICPESILSNVGLFF